MGFKKATKEKAKARVCLAGPSGSGKTYTGLSLVTALGKRPAVIDTERGSASKYADLFEFDTLELESFSPASYSAAIAEAVKGGYDAVLIDSLSHVWIGRDGALAMVNELSKRSASHNKFQAWGDVTPEYDALMDDILRCPMHVVVTLRVKTDYVIEVNDKGKSVPRKVGLAPQLREGSEYEFDIVGQMTEMNELIISKSRCRHLTGKVISRPGKDLADVLDAWLTDGAEVPVLKTLADHFSEVATLEALKVLAQTLVSEGKHERTKIVAEFNRRKAELLSAEEVPNAS